MIVNDQVMLRITADDFSIPLPRAIADAEALRAAAGALLDKITAETAPHLDTLTAKNIDQVHAHLVAWPSHDARRDAAVRLVGLADSRLSTAWDGAQHVLLEAFRKPYDDAGDRYLAGDREALPTMAALARVWDLLVPRQARAKRFTGRVEEYTRILAIPSMDVALRVIPIREEGVERYSPKWFDIVTAIDGVRPEWHTPAEQETLDLQTAGALA